MTRPNLTKVSLFIATFVSPGALAAVSCRDLGLKNFGKKLPADALLQPAVGIAVYDLDPSTQAPNPPQWVSAEWSARKSKNLHQSSDLYGFFLDKAEPLSAGGKSGASVVVVDSTSKPQLLQHELLHAAYAKANPKKENLFETLQAQKSKSTEELLNAMKSIPSVNKEAFATAVQDLASAINRSITYTNIEESLIDCLMLEDKNTPASLAKELAAHALNNIDVARAPFVSLKDLITKTPAKYQSSVQPINTYLDHIAQIENKILDLYAASKPNSQCEWCIAANPEAKNQANALAQLSAEEILARLKTESLALKTFDAGRKFNPKTFHWGSLVSPTVLLKDIGSDPHLTGKTLCKGELPVSENSMTILVASDAPKSTLIHEYLHTKQIARLKTWCAASKESWKTKKMKSTDYANRLIAEWDVHTWLWLHRDELKFNIEDQINVASNLIDRAKDYEQIDPGEARLFLRTQNVEGFLKKAIPEYMLYLKNL